MSMTASTSRQDSVPGSRPSNVRKEQTKQRISRKGKAKEEPHSSESAFTNQQSWSSVDDGLSWDWIPLTDPSASKVPPVFTKDGSYFFSLVGSLVKIHSTSTGEVVSTLSSPPKSPGSQPGLLTSAILNPHNTFQLITGSLDGRLLLWDFLEATLLRTIEVVQPIHHICAHKDVKDAVFVAVTRPPKTQDATDDNGAVLRVSLSTQPTSDRPVGILAVGKTRFPAGLTISPSGSWLVAIAGHKVYVATVSDLKSGFTKFVSPERLTCLAFHPVDEYFATGDAKGCIRLWYCLNDQLPAKARGVEKKAPTTTLHWHAHAVSSIAFTSNGAYLLSGGEEAVLVIWQLHTGRKEFIPRVGSPINTVALWRNGDVEEYLLGLADATYLYVSSATLKVVKSISRIKLDSSSVALPSSSHPPSLAIHSSTSTLILPSSHPSSLQIYSPGSFTSITELEVAPSNRISRRDEIPIEPSRVVLATTSQDSRWMATVDVRDGEGSFRDEVYLKFWAWEAAINQWILNTRIDKPHGQRKIAALSFNPATQNTQGPQCVSIGEDGKIKVWRLKSSKTSSGDFWVANSTHEFRNEIPQALSWSSDGSLVAVALGQHIVLFDPASNTIAHTLPSSDSEPVVSVKFIGQTGRYLAAATKSTLHFWDLIANTIKWHYNPPHPIVSIHTTTANDAFTVFHDQPPDASFTPISIFRPTSSTPVRKYIVPFALRNVCGYFSGSRYIGITKEWRVVLFGDDIQRPIDEGSVARGLGTHQITARRSLLHDIFGSTAFTDLLNVDKSSKSTKPHVPGGDLVGRVFDTPVYTTPPITNLFEPLIESFLQIRSSDPVPLSNEGAQDEDEDVLMEEDPPNLTPSSQAHARKIDDEEMQSLANIFKEHCIKVTPQIHTAPKLNGASHAPKTPTLQIHQNGHSASKSKPTPIVKEVRPASPPPSPPTPVSLVNGKKRKKS
ncbi:WD40 repeat-like protein [Pluteus cervinus]|uniref:WD40 repeat-like protein n=1 Tax=Pluteus cervinus TaxID=181527 RepID=A0ACD3BI77_9AGAR|nr:WD40 repeat-like protein [Pluteus cervinus]